MAEPIRLSPHHVIEIVGIVNEEISAVDEDDFRDIHGRWVGRRINEVLRAVTENYNTPIEIVRTPLEDYICNGVTDCDRPCNLRDQLWGTANCLSPLNWQKGDTKAQRLRVEYGETYSFTDLQKRREKMDS